MRHDEYRGKSALVHYRGGAVGDEPVEDHMTGDPVRILLGAGEVPPGVDEALYDMDIGEKRLVVIPCDKAYGQHDPDGVQTYPRSYLRCGNDLQEGDLVMWTHPMSGRDVLVEVVKATDVAVVIDFNHPLADMDLEYCLELVDVVDEKGVSIRAGAEG